MESVLIDPVALWFRLPGQRFGRLVIIDAEAGWYTEPSGKRLRAVLARCDCGTEQTFRMKDLRNGKTQSCGCSRIGQVRASRRLCAVMGQRFGRLTVVGAELRKNGTRVVPCRCDCGTPEKIIAIKALYRKTKSCGCLRADRIAQAKTQLRLRKGQRFGRLKVLNPEAPREQGSPRVALCACACGAELVVSIKSLTSGMTRSCGCWKLELLAVRAREMWKDPGYVAKLLAHTQTDAHRERARAWMTRLWQRKLSGSDNEPVYACPECGDGPEHPLWFWTAEEFEEHFWSDLHREHAPWEVEDALEALRWERRQASR